MFSQNQKRFSAITPMTGGGGRSKLPRTVQTSASKTGGRQRNSSEITGAVGRSGGARPSSFYGRPMQMGFKETRPLSDKGYQSDMIMKLISFLQDTKYPYPLKERELRQPNKSDFMRIFEHIYQQIDPEYRCEIGKLVEVVPKMFRDLGYPVTIKTSTMQTISATHSWPHILGALTWLIDLIKFFSSVDFLKVMYPEEDDFNEGEISCRKQILFTYHIQCFTFYMQNMDRIDDPQLFGGYNIWLEEQLMKEYAGIDSLDGLKKLAAKLTEEKEELRTAPRIDSEIEEQNSILQKDLKKMDDYHSQLTDYRDSIKEQVTAAQNQRSIVEQQIQALRQQVALKQETIANQKMSGADARQLKFNKNEVEHQIDQIRLDCGELEKEKWDQERDVSHQRQTIEKAHSLFLQRVRAILAKVQPPGVDWQSQVTRMSPFDPKFKENYSTTLESNVQLLWQFCNNAVHDVNSDVLEIQETFDQVKENLSAIMEEQEEVEGKIHQLDRDQNEEKDNNANQVKRLKEEIAEFKSSLDVLKSDIDVTCEQKVLQINRLKNERNQLAQRQESELTDKCKEISRCVEHVMSHHEQLQKMKAEILADHRKLGEEWKVMKQQLQEEKLID